MFTLPLLIEYIHPMWILTKTKYPNTLKKSETIFPVVKYKIGNSSDSVF